MIKKYLINKNISIKQTIKRINEAASKIVFVVDMQNILIGSVSDGDIRRAILNGYSFDINIMKIMNKNPIYFYENYSMNELKKTLIEKKIEVVPITNKDKKIIKILFWNDIFKERKQEFSQINFPVVIMAGGKGTRLDPFTRILPKPLIPIGDKAMIEVIMDEYAKFGMKFFYISINHKGKMIRAYFEDHKSDYNFQFIEETKPLGTAGSLKYLEGRIDTPFFVSNCDILIKEDYTKIYELHKKKSFSLTLIASMQNHIIPYGVCEIENGGKLKKIIEKPQFDFLVNTGMYIIEPKVLEFISKDTYLDMTDLINILLNSNEEVCVFPISEKSWIDIGQVEEYMKFLKNFSNI